MSDFTRTPNYQLYKPTPNADNDAWGSHINANADTIDTTLYTAAGGGAFTAKTGTAYTVTATDCSMILQPSAAFTLTLPVASASAGRILRLKLIAAFAVNSASSNVVQLTGGAATAAIMPATSGKFCHLQSDGTNWQIMAAN